MQTYVGIVARRPQGQHDKLPELAPPVLELSTPRKAEATTGPSAVFSQYIMEARLPAILG